MSMEEKISTFQNDLELARKAAGLSRAKMGEIVGLTRQSIYNLERGITKMTKMQYIAFQVVLRYKLESDDYTWLSSIVDQ